MKCINCGTEMNSTTGGNYTCPKCGRKQFGRSKYCGDCGYKLIWEEENG